MTDDIHSKFLQPSATLVDVFQQNVATILEQRRLPQYNNAKAQLLFRMIISELRTLVTDLDVIVSNAESNFPRGD